MLTTLVPFSCLGGLNKTSQSYYIYTAIGFRNRRVVSHVRMTTSQTWTASMIPSPKAEPAMSKSKRDKSLIIMASWLAYCRINAQVLFRCLDPTDPSGI
jgi:hypothetical protein